MTNINEEKKKLLMAADALKGVNNQIHELNVQKSNILRHLQKICKHPSDLVVTQTQSITMEGDTEPQDKEVSYCYFCEKQWLVEEEKVNDND